MLLTPSNLNIYFTGLTTLFNSVVGVTPVFSPKISTTIPCPTSFWLSGWLDMVDKPRVWVGPRITRTPAPLTYQIPIQLYELTEMIDLFKLQDDQHGIYSMTVTHMAQNMAKNVDWQIRDLMQNQGFWTSSAYQNSYDNVNYWNTAHNVDFWDSSKGSYPNDYTGGGVTVNSTLIGGGLAANAFATVFEDMSRRKNASGEAWGVTPSDLMTGPMMKLTADSILQAQFIGLPVIGNLGTGTISASGSAANNNQLLVGATENVMKSYADILMWPDLGGSTSIGGGTYDQVWYLLDLRKPVKPFVWLQNMAPDFVIRNRPDDPAIFETHSVIYGSKSRGTPTWSFPVLASRSGP